MAPLFCTYQRIFVFLLLTCPLLVRAQSSSTSFNSSISPAAVFENISNLPSVFRKNEGQWPSDVLYRGFIHGTTVSFLPDGLSFGLAHEREDLEDPHQGIDHPETPHSEPYDYFVWNVYFRNMLNTCTISASGEQESIFNYFKSSAQAIHVPDFSTLTYTNVYNDIDLRYYNNGQNIKYDYVIRPGANISDIQMGCSGIQHLSIDADGALKINTAFGELHEGTPYSYQVIGGVIQPVNVNYILLNDSTYGFTVSGNYNPQIPLVIDPVILEWSTYVGGTGNGYIFDIALDNAGNVYGTGFYNAGMPTTPGVYDATYNTPGSCGFAGGDEDAYVFKMNPVGTAFVWCTYLGGTCRDRGRGIALDPAGNVYVTGWTESTNFPSVNPYQLNNAGYIDVFAAKFDPTGTNLIYSTYIGGVYNDWPEKIAVNANGEAFMCGASLDLGGVPGFPTTAGSVQPVYGGGSYQADAYVLKLNAAGNNLIYSTYLGGNGWDWAMSIKINSNDEAFVTGKCNAGFPTTSGAFQTVNGGGQNVFVSRINSTGSALIYSTFLGGTGGDVGNSIAINSADEAFVTGNIHSPNFPVTPGCFDNSYNGGTYGDAFVTRLNATGSALIASSYIGTANLDIGWGIDVDVNNNIFIAGYTDDANFPTTTCAVDNTFNSPGSADFVIFKMDPLASTMIYSSYLGGNDQDYWEPKLKLIGSTCDQRLIFCGTTHSTNMPTTIGVMQPNKLNGVDDQPFIFKMRPKINAGFTMSAIAVCTGTPVNFLDTTTQCGLWDTLSIHNWDFGDGNLATGISVSHSYATPGTYTVTLIVGCPMDTETQIITVTGGNGFTFTPPPGQCLDGNNFDFTIAGTFPAGTTFAWNFGPNANPPTSTLENPTGIVFSTSGLQNISVTVTDPGCGVSTANQTVMVFPPPIASATATPTLTTLENADIQFTNTTAGAVSSAWDFGDNYQSTNTNPNHTYTATGNYNVTLIVVDANGCVDTTTITIVVDDQSTFYIPNAFSPNGDGLNDFFTGIGTGITDFHMMVWDRWGMLIFESYDIAKPWDGTFKGKKVEEDVYVYHIDVTNLQSESNYYTGHVSVIR